jgi:hypothetical protein
MKGKPFIPSGQPLAKIGEIEAAEALPAPILTEILIRNGWSMSCRCARAPTTEIEHLHERPTP